MKRFFYWFLWLQLLMPFSVSLAGFSAFFACTEEDYTKEPLFYACAGCYYFAPVLLVNSALVATILIRATRTRTQALTLGLDCAVAYGLVAALLFGKQAPLIQTIAFTVAWFTTGALSIIVALRLEPGKQRRSRS